MNTYLQRADDFIQQQIYKFEQRKHGRDYTEMQNSPKSTQRFPSRAHTFNNLPPQGPPAPRGWSQEFDPQSNRWYYLDRATGHSQWETPSMLRSRRGLSHTFSDQQPQTDTSRDTTMARGMQEEEKMRNRGRASLQYTRPHHEHLGAPSQHRHSISLQSSPHGRLPPGAHLDMKTGQFVTNMFP
ncbi:hypothetical protein GQ44DRAFT_551326, partial [Phaeosphaeriaceae sp. PMI808]